MLVRSTNSIGTTVYLNRFSTKKIRFLIGRISFGATVITTLILDFGRSKTFHPVIPTRRHVQFVSVCNNGNGLVLKFGRGGGRVLLVPPHFCPIKYNQLSACEPATRTSIHHPTQIFFNPIFISSL